MRGVWWSSFRASISWSRESSTRTQGRKPRDEARWRDVLESPALEGSGFRRRCGWVFRMRWIRRGSAAWMARRRRREGSILGVGGEVSFGDCEEGGGGDTVEGLREERNAGSGSYLESYMMLALL